MDNGVLPEAGGDVEQQPLEEPLVVVVQVPPPPPLHPVDTELLQREPGPPPVDTELLRREPDPPPVDTELLQREPDPPPVDTELLQREPGPPPVDTELPPCPRDNLELPKLVLEFCLTAAIGIASQSVQNRKQYPLTFHMACLMMVFALASIVVAKYVHQNYPNGARVLENVGVVFGITSFFFAITTSFPIWLTIISWFIYALSLLTILACNDPKSLFS
ncbi:hypothetical protein Acr_04g0004330 [Actinidia rufa]|uniref:Uncharacterized protein n=1 Tax=Actinidia rufa TaxID=165716 RepID=A0A7J0EGT2_9ERIC|nr:hypothetical protein Acr_04g0004330 [Actinidia rufa]